MKMNTALHNVSFVWNFIFYSSFKHFPYKTEDYAQLCIGITLSCKNKRHEIVTSTLILRLTIDSIKAQEPVKVHDFVSK